MIIYADFSCPACYLADRRADLLRGGRSADLDVDVDWRAVESRPRLPVTGQRLDPAEQDALRAEFAELERLLLPGETLPHEVPAFVPRTEAAVTAYAEAYPTGVGDEVRQLLLRLYWLQGADIGSPTVLRTPLTGPVLRGASATDALRLSGFAVSVDRGPITTAAWRRIRAWREQWQQLGAPELPVLLDAGRTFAGRDALAALGERIRAAGVSTAAPTADLLRYPAVPDRPDVHWVSWHGGRWRTSYRLPAA